MDREIDSFCASIGDESGAALRFLSKPAAKGVGLAALTAVPIGTDKAQTTRFPTDPQQLARVASLEGLTPVYPAEADYRAGRMSVLPPAGRAILGLVAGRKIGWPVPSGAHCEFGVVELLHQPEAAGDRDL